MFKRVLLCVLCLTPSFVCAQVLPDPALWNGGFTNPNGEQAVPAVIYNAATGVMSLNTAGLNQIRDTTVAAMIAGDDVGFVVMQVPSPEPIEFLLDGFVPNPNIGGGLGWSSAYFLGKSQLFGNTAGADFLEPSVNTPIIQYQPGYDCADFGTVELWVNFESGIPSEGAFGAVQCVVPEPHGSAMIWPALISILISKCRRNTPMWHDSQSTT